MMLKSAPVRKGKPFLMTTAMPNLQKLSAYKLWSCLVGNRVFATNRVSLTQAEMAEMTGMTPRTVSAALAELGANDLVRMGSGNKSYILSPFDNASGVWTGSREGRALACKAFCLAERVGDRRASRKPRASAQDSAEA